MLYFVVKSKVHSSNQAWSGLTTEMTMVHNATNDW